MEEICVDVYEICPQTLGCPCIGCIHQEVKDERCICDRTKDTGIPVVGCLGVIGGLCKHYKERE